MLTGFAQEERWWRFVLDIRGRACGHCMSMRQGQPATGHAVRSNRHTIPMLPWVPAAPPVAPRCLKCVAGGHPHRWLQLKSRQHLVDCE